jgi:coenzyme F420-0:L-glutamate ligase
MNRAFVEAVLRESDFVLKGLQGFLLTIKDGFFAPNAGVDKSNIPKGCVILHPSDSMAMAARIRREVLLSMGAKVAVVITDSRLQPLRKGTVGVSVGFSGIEAVVDDRGRADLFGNLLKVTRRAIADNISSAVQLVMGESDEGVPVAIVRGLAHFVADIDGYDSSVEPEECIFVRGLSSYSSATA